MDDSAPRLVPIRIQQMHVILAGRLGPEAWLPEHIPEVDDVRPKRCRRCGVLGKRDGRVVLHGHGRGKRGVVVLPLTDDGSELSECWKRRFLCTACGAVLVVLPRGVLPRYLYCVAAVAMGFFLVAEPPVGDGKSHEEARALQGMYKTKVWNAAEPYRWRSLDRWERAAASWWSDLWTGDLRSLLAAFVERGGGGREAALRAAVSTHGYWGEAM